MKKNVHIGLITVAVCFGVFFIGSYSQYQLSPIAGAVMEEMGINLPQFSLLFTVCMYPALVLSLISGVLCDKFGAKRSVTLALTLSTIGIVGRAFSPGYTVTLGCMVLLGLGCMFLTATCAKILAPYFGERLGQVMGPVSSGNTIGMFVAMATTAYFPSTKSAFTVSAVLGIVILAAWVIFTEDPKPVRGDMLQGVPISRSLKVCFKNPYIWLCGATLLLVMVGQIMIASSLPIALQTLKGMSVSVTGMVSSVYMIGAVIGAVFGPQIFFGLKRGKRIFITVCAIATGLGVAFAWHISNVFLLCVALLLCGACLSTFVPTMFAIPVNLPGIGSENGGTAGGLVATIEMLGCTVIPTNILIPLFTDSANVTDFENLFLVCGVIAACAAVTVNLLPIYKKN